MKSTQKKLVITVLLSLCVFVPNFLLYVNASETVRISAVPVEGKFYDYSKTQSDGSVNVRWRIKFHWFYEGEKIGYVWQYVWGTIEGGKADLHGRGTFYSSNDELPGTLRYWIGNKWDMTTNEIWDFRMHVYGGTESFSGVRGSVEADGPDFLMGLTRNPWE